ncbi:MAG: site-2 protease family protein [Gammaproteobacteria bacterium]|jgi:Zn-dependent protease|nr:site-2 protease family protein [Gammaproteobacteria bacterium]
MPDFQTLLIWVIPVLLAITLHEAAHGWMASKFGDHTARMMGRVTLNPVKHIDPVGTIVVPLALLVMSTGFIFGWAKPVPINFNALRSPKSGMIWVALAGPGANLIMAIGWIFIAILSINIPVMLKMAGAGIFINILLAVFNLLPIPPLDGSRVISALLPNPLAYKYNQLERYGFVILIGLMFIGGFSYIVWPIVGLALSSLSVISGLNLINLMSYVFS